MQQEKNVGAPVDIVVIGGGTGNSTVLEGLKPWAGDGLTAVVNTFDDGGSTGEIRKEYGGIAVGDIRQCAKAMSDLSPRALRVLEDRVRQGSGKGSVNIHKHTVGNFLIEQAMQLYADDPEESIDVISELYRIRGQVLPVSRDSSHLRFDLPDGTVIEGEHNAEETDIPSMKGARISFDNGGASLSEEAKVAIEESSLVVLAPGDLYTSIGPNLAVRGMKESLQKTKAVVMVSNLMNRGRHTVGYDTLDYALEYERIIGAKVIQRVIYNTEALNPKALAYQAAEYGSHPVDPNVEGLRYGGYRPYGTNLLSHDEVKKSKDDPIAETRSDIRHDPKKVASAIIGVYLMNGFGSHE